MKNRVIFLVLTFAVVMTFESVTLLAQDIQSGHGNLEPPMAGIQWDKEHTPDHGAKAGGSGSSPNLTWHGGNIMSSVQTTAIFWGQNWDKPAFIDKITGIDSFYKGIGNSTYAQTSDEYNGGGYVSATITYNDKFIDLTAAPGNGNKTSTILAEVCKVITNPISSGYYPVYVDTPRRGSYCAWHSYGSCQGIPVQFAFFFNLDGDWGCDPQDTSRLHSQGLAALANMSGHEISEARTDPRLNAWYDNSGQENADKCSWSFGTPLVTFSNGSQWKIQGNWSNRAYNSRTEGYANRSGQKGCIDGGNYN